MNLFKGRKMDFGTYMTGSCGPSQALYRARNEYKRGRGSAKSVDKQILLNSKELVELQKNLGFDFVSDPQFRFYDLFQPFVETVEEMDFGPQENWFNNNVFYRRPQVSLPLKETSESIVYPYINGDFLKSQGKVMAVLPSPLTFFLLSDFPKEVEAKEAVIAVAKLLKNEAERLAAKGISRIHFDEPAIVMKQTLGSVTQEDIDLLRVGMEEIGYIDGVDTILYTYFGNAAPLLSFFKELPVNGVGVDCTETGIKEIAAESFQEKELVLGLVDARSPAMEKPHRLVEKLMQVAEATNPKKLWLTPNSGSLYIGWTLGNKKLHLLQEAKKGFEVHA